MLFEALPHRLFVLVNLWLVEFIAQCHAFSKDTSISPSGRDFMCHALTTNHRNSDWLCADTRCFYARFMIFAQIILFRLRKLNFVFTTTELTLFRSFQLSDEFRAAWSNIERVPNFVSYELECVYWCLFEFVSIPFFQFSVLNRQVVPSTRKQYNTALNTLAKKMNFESGNELVVQLTTKVLHPSEILLCIYKLITFAFMSPSYIQQMSSALKYTLSRRSLSIYTYAPSWNQQLKRLVKLSDHEAHKHGAVLTADEIFAVCTALLARGFEGIWLISVFMICFFTGFRREVFATLQWANLDGSKFESWIALHARTNKNSKRVYPCYFPKGEGLFNFDFMFQVLFNVAPKSKFIFVRPKTKRVFSNSLWTSLVLGPVNEVMSILQLSPLYGKTAFTCHSWRYCIASFLTDDLLLPSVVTASALRHLTFDAKTFYSRTAKIYVLSKREVNSYGLKLKEFADKNSKWKSFWNQNPISSAAYYSEYPTHPKF